MNVFEVQLLFPHACFYSNLICFQLSQEQEYIQVINFNKLHKAIDLIELTNERLS